jgi:hypothetical protein
MCIIIYVKKSFHSMHKKVGTPLISQLITKVSIKNVHLNNDQMVKDMFLKHGSEGKWKVQTFTLAL